MARTSRATLLTTAGVLIALGLTIYAIISKAAPSEYDGFAQCLTEQNVTMYGAYWCPHCQNQKKIFGNAFQYVAYVECATPGLPNVMTKEGEEAGVEGYPTWINASGEIVAGEQSLEELATFSGCVL